MDELYFYGSTIAIAAGSIAKYPLCIAELINMHYLGSEIATRRT